MGVRHEITSPDGIKYWTEGPDGSTREDAIRMAPQLLREGKLHRVDATPEPETKEQFDVGMGQILPSVGRAAAALPGSVAKGVGDIWNMVTHGDEVIASLKEKGWEGITKDIGADLKEHYGSLERAKRTFETDPFRFITDISLPLTGGTTAVTKLGLLGAKVGRKVLPEVAARTTGLEASALRTAGEAGLRGRPEAAEFRAGVGGLPSPAAAQTAGMPAAPALAHQGAMAPFGRAGRDIGQAGWMPESKRLGGALLAGGALNPKFLAALPAMSPRLMGEAARGLGAAERRLGQVPTRALTRTAIATGAADLLRDRGAKARLTNEEVKVLRRAARKDAPSDTMQAAQRILDKPRVQTESGEPSSFAERYGGLGGESVSSTRAIQQRQEGGPVTPGQTYLTGERAPETLVTAQGAQTVGAGGPELITPQSPGAVIPGEEKLAAPGGQSPGLSRLPTTGEEPIATTHGGKTFFEFAWDKVLKGTTEGIEKARGESFKAAMGEEFDPSATLKTATYGIGGAMPFAQKGAIGAAGGRLKIPEATVPLGTHAVEQKLGVNQILDVKAPAMFEPRSRNVRDIAQGLHARGSEALKEMGVPEGKITAEMRTPDTDSLLARTLASEAKEAMQRSGHAADWYTKGVEEAVKEASKIYPEIATDTGARTAFTAAKAITSQGETVPSNVRLTDQVYEYFRKHGRFPTDIKADKQKYINGNFVKMNALLKHFNGMEEVSKFLETKFSVKEIVQLMKAAGIKGGPGALKFPVDYQVYGSSILGPKIGHGFYQNLIGNFNPVTTDLWLMRTWGRMTGTLHGRPGAVGKAQARLEKALTAAGEEVPKDIKALTKRAEQITDAHEKDFKTNRALYDTGEKTKSELTKAAERLQANLSGIKETPSSGGERVWIAQVMDQARQLLERQGIKVTNADLQAILWYPEKDLYAKLGGRPSEGINVNYAQAWRDFAAKRKKQ